MDASEFTVKQALETTAKSSDLSEREKHLVGLAVTLTRGCQACSGRRMEEALKSGIPYASVQATIDLTAAVNAGVVLRTAIEGAARHAIDEACSGPECAVEAE